MVSQKEYDHPKGLVNLTKSITSSRKPVLINIAGGSCSGKSYFATKLKDRIKELGWQASIIILDYYFRDIDEPDFPKNQEGKLLFDVPESYRKNRFIQDVLKLIEGDDIQMPDYDVSTNKILSDCGETVPANQIIIAEGLFTIDFLNGICSNTKNVYIDTPEQMCLKRRIERDTQRYNVDSEKVIATWEKKVLPCYHKFVEPQRDLANFIIKE